jgi:hypothetical protein
MLHAFADKQQIPIYSLWFDLIGAQTHDLPSMLTIQKQNVDNHNIDSV